MVTYQDLLKKATEMASKALPEISTSAWPWAAGYLRHHRPYLVHLYAGGGRAAGPQIKKIIYAFVLQGRPTVFWTSAGTLTGSSWASSTAS